MAKRLAWCPTEEERLAYAAALRLFASLEAQADTVDPAFAVGIIEWMISSYSRRGGERP